MSAEKWRQAIQIIDARDELPITDIEPDDLTLENIEEISLRRVYEFSGG